MYHPNSGNGPLVDGAAPPSPTRSRKRKRGEAEEDYNTPTKTRSRATLGLPTPNEKGSQVLLQEGTHFIDVSVSSGTPEPNLGFAISNSTDTSNPSAGFIHIQAQQMTPPSSVSPSGLPALPGAQESSPSRTRSSVLSSRTNVPFPNLMLSMPYFLIQPPDTALHNVSLEASVLALRRVLTLHTSNSATQVLTMEQECHAWIMFAELGLQIINSLKAPSQDIRANEKDPPNLPFPAKSHTLKHLEIPFWAPQPGEIETAISRALRLADQVASLRWLRHNLTILHAQLVCLQDNQKHAKVLLKRLLPFSNSAQPLARERVWASYEAHLAITDQILTRPSGSSETIDVQAAMSQLNALAMLANQYGDHSLVQLISVIRLTTLFQNYEFSDSISAEDMNSALKEAESILGLDGFDEPTSSSKGKPTVNGASFDSSGVTNLTPAGTAADNGDQLVTPFTADSLSSAGTKVAAHLKTPAFSFPTNPLGMNVYGAENEQPAEAVESTDDSLEKGLILPYLRYLRVQTLMLGVLWLTHSGESTRSSERLTLLHEMMDKLNGLSKVEGWASDKESGLISIPLYSNPERPLRIQSTHPRVLYQLTFVISAIAKRDCLGRKPKRKVFAQEGLRISSADDPRATDEPKPDILDGGSAFDFAPGLGLRDLRYAQQSIAQIRATAYYELVAACLIRSELEEAEQHLADLVSFVRTPIESQSPQTSLWDQFASRITLLYGHLAHMLGQSQRALECYQTVCLLEDEESTMWAMGKVGEIVLRIGAAAIRAEERAKDNNVDTTEDQKDGQQVWVPGERERLVEMASGLVDRCLDGGLGQHLAVVGRLMAASLSSEIVRAKQNLKSGLDLSCKGRDNYLRLLVLIFTAGQYLYTHTDYALTILETCRQLASSLGAVAAPNTRDVSQEESRRSTRSTNTQDQLQYHVGHARAGLWIGQRFSELYKRRGDLDKAGKQNAVNTVFQKAIDATNLWAGRTGASDTLGILEDLPPARTASQPTVHSFLEADRRHAGPSKASLKSVSKSKATKKGPKDDNTVVSEQSQDTRASYPPSSPAASESKHRSKRSDTSYSRSSVSGHSHHRSVASTGSRRSTRERGERKVIIESDDEETALKAMSEDDFQGSELEDSDGEVHL